MGSDDGNDNGDTPPDKDPSQWNDCDEFARQLLEEVGYDDTETSGNLIYNKIVGVFAYLAHPDRMAEARREALILKIMFRRWGAFGELDFDP